MTVKTTVAVWVRLPLAAVIVIVYVPGGVLCSVRTVSVDVPDPPELSETLLELKLSRGPLGVQTAERDTVPVNPAVLAMLIVTVPLVPAARLRDDGFTARVKS